MLHIETRASIIRMTTAFFLLSLFTLLGSQARMLPGDYGTFGISSINYNKEKGSISSLADPIIISMMSSYRKNASPPPPPPDMAPDDQFITISSTTGNAGDYGTSGIK